MLAGSNSTGSNPALAHKCSTSCYLVIGMESSDVLIKA